MKRLPWNTHKSGGFARRVWAVNPRGGKASQVVALIRKPAHGCPASRPFKWRVDAGRQWDAEGCATSMASAKSTATQQGNAMAMSIEKVGRPNPKNYRRRRK